MLYPPAIALMFQNRYFTKKEDSAIAQLRTQFGG
jgi:hypothetical protein